MLESHDLIRLGLRTLIENDPKLQSAGTFNHLDDAYLHAKDLTPDVILLDLSLSKDYQTVPALLNYFPQSKVLAFSELTDEQIHLHALLGGAMGIVAKNQCTELLTKAILTVHSGQVWIDRNLMTSFWRQQTTEQSNQKRSTSHHPFAHVKLSQRENDIAQLATKGHSAKDIGRRLGISEKTVRNYLTFIYCKLGVENRIELCLKAKNIDF